MSALKKKMSSAIPEKLTRLEASLFLSLFKNDKPAECARLRERFPGADFMIAPEVNGFTPDGTTSYQRVCLLWEAIHKVICDDHGTEILVNKERDSTMLTHGIAAILTLHTVDGDYRTTHKDASMDIAQYLKNLKSNITDLFIESVDMFTFINIGRLFTINVSRVEPSSLIDILAGLIMASVYQNDSTCDCPNCVARREAEEENKDEEVANEETEPLDEEIPAGPESKKAARPLRPARRRRVNDDVVVQDASDISE